MSRALTYFLSFAVICLLILISLYLQYMKGVMPCPLCMLQRLTFCLLGFLFLVGFFLSKNRACRLTLNVLCSLVSVLGLSLAGRQIWLQYYPSSASNECGVGLQYMMQILPLNEVVQKIFAGSAECSQKGWQFLSLNMAQWAFLWFSLSLLLSLFLFYKDIKSPL